jgi:putative endonuclease
VQKRGGPHRGEPGEELACQHLRGRGLRIAVRNYRCRAGEIDIVAWDGETLVFVEVKERRGDSHGRAVEAVTALKRARVIRAARLYAASEGLSEAPIRFDVIAIDWTAQGPSLRHDEGAFSAAG